MGCSGVCFNEISFGREESFISWLPTTKVLKLTESTVLELWQDGQAARNGGNRTADELDHFGRPSEVVPCLYPARTTLIRTSAIVLHFASANTPDSSLSLLRETNQTGSWEACPALFWTQIDSWYSMAGCTAFAGTIGREKQTPTVVIRSDIPKREKKKPFSVDFNNRK